MVPELRTFSFIKFSVQGFLLAGNEKTTPFALPRKKTGNYTQSGRASTAPKMSKNNIRVKK